MNNDNNLINRSFFKKGDLLFILLILLIGCIIAFVNNQQRDGDKIAVIYINGKQISSIDLNMVKDPYDVKISEDNNLIVRVEKGRIRYLHSDCRDQICVNAGWLDEHGDFAACAPFKSAISIVSDQSSVGNEPDMILS